MGSGSSKQVKVHSGSGNNDTGTDDKVENIDIRSRPASNFNISGTKEKIKPALSSSLNSIETEIKYPKIKKNLELKSMEKNLQKKNFSESELKSKSTNIVEGKVSDTTECRTETLTPVHVANISQLSPLQSTCTKQNGQSISDMSKADQMDMLKQLELQMAKSESQRLDALDQLKILEEKLKGHELHNSTQTNNEMSETIHAKDQLILKLEKDLQASEAEAKTTRLKLKRRIKALNSRLQEARQELSIGQMELKGEISQLKDKIRNSNDQANNSMIEATSSKSSPQSQSKLIVELSNQMTEQSERIKVLENQLTERDAQILSLKSLNSKSGSRTYEPGMKGVTGDRLRSGRGSRHSTSTAKLNDNLNSIGSSDQQPSYSRQSTALSDSDTEWDVKDVRPQTLSAPARTRIKSSAPNKQIAKVGGVPCEDDSLQEYMGTAISAGSAVTTHSLKKSALRKHLEKKKDNHTDSLMGPSLAFSPPDQGPPNDSLSLESTPRYQDNPARLPGFSKLSIVQT